MGVLSWFETTLPLTPTQKRQTSSPSNDLDQAESPTASSSGMADTAAELPFSGPVTPSAKDIKADLDVDVEKTGDDSLSEKESHSQHDGDMRDADTKELTPMESARWDVSGDRSPFPEVQACVSTDDDVGLEVNTFRMWVLTTIFVMLFSGVNVFFSLRYPSLSLNYVVAQLLVFPIGRLWERLPTWRVGFGRWTFRINPGRFHIKEHAIIVICVNLTNSTAYGMNSLVAMTSKEYWGLDYGAGFGVLYIFTSQVLGFATITGTTRSLKSAGIRKAAPFMTVTGYLVGRISCPNASLSIQVSKGLLVDLWVSTTTVGSDVAYTPVAIRTRNY